MKIVWSHLAERSYYTILIYLNENWPLVVVQDFILDVEKTMILISDNPEIFRWWDLERKYKIGYINTNISLFYNFDNSKIMIHLFWDKRQNPEKLKKILL